MTGFYTEDLMLAIPKKEYLFGTTSSLADSASFGLDFGETSKHPMPYTQAAELATRRARADVAQRSRAAPVLP